jgi:cob(I)alamin adenosyltransferase
MNPHLRHGLLIINTGDGKGKTTAALGLALRAAGCGMRTTILQFVKRDEAGEHRALADLPGEPIDILRLGTGFVTESPPPPEATEATRAALAEARRRLTGGQWDMVVLDEIFAALAAGLVTEDDILSLVTLRPPAVHLVLTGRAAPESVIDLADLVTEMRCIKHPHDHGVAAQEGIEF